MTFSLAYMRDRYYVHRDPDPTIRLYLCGGAPQQHWSSDISDARVFQYRLDALRYVLTNTKLTTLLIDHEAYRIAINYQTKIVYITQHNHNTGAIQIALPSDIITAFQSLHTLEEIIPSKRANK